MTDINNRPSITSIDEWLRLHKEANRGRGMWENHTCSRCKDGWQQSRCPVAHPRLCEYPRATND